MGVRSTQKIILSIHRLHLSLDPEDKDKWRRRPYRSYLGVIGYLMLATRNDCAFAYQALARFNDSYGQDHWDALIALIAYLRKSRDTYYLSISKHAW